jgi:hypothetical protein
MEFLTEHHQQVLFTVTGGSTLLSLLFGVISENRLSRVEKQLDKRNDQLEEQLVILKTRQDYHERS